MRWIALFLLSLVMPACVVAQKTEDEIKARLVGKALYLRGQWSKDKLQFDEQGHVDKPVPTVPFTLSGVQIDSVDLSGKELVLRGKRVGLEFVQDVPARMTLKEEMTFRVKRPDTGDFTAALDAIFADSLAGFDAPMPDYWRWFAEKHLLGGTATAAASGTPLDPRNAGAGASAPTDKVGGSVTAPVATFVAQPTFPEAVRAMKFTSVVLVNLIVATDGMPAGVHVLRPAGLGLDEAAVAAVSQYRFKPAMKNGRPVAVELNVMVNFQVF
jgi:TonB family protein